MNVASLALRPLCEPAHRMICIDTGPAHAAAALGLPQVVLFGGQPQSRRLPRSAC
jgi:ADP-heptose:LPS heptosyltransferase